MINAKEGSNASLTPDAHGATEDVLSVEARFSLTTWCFLAFSIGAGVMLLRDLGASWQFALVHLTMYLLGTIAYLARRTVSALSNWFMLGAAYLMGASGLGAFGVDAANLLLLTLAGLGAAVLLGDRVGLWGALFSMLTAATSLAIAYPVDPAHAAQLAEWRGDAEAAAAAAALMTVLIGLVRFARQRMRRLIAIQMDQAQRLRDLVQALDGSNQRLQLLNERLEEQVRSRTADLEAFAYTVAHDLRAPLRTIDAFAQMIAPRPELPSSAVCVDRIRAGVTHAMEITSSVLRLLGLNYVDRPIAPVDLSNIACEVLADLRAAEPSRSIEVHVQPDLHVMGDPALLHQLLQNLLGNAWKFTAQTTAPKISVGAWEEPERTVYFVKDNGVGFDSRYKEKLFSPFQRLHDANEFAGTGVGLATVKRIVAMHGGHIWADGDPGRGATFFFTLPGLCARAFERPPTDAGVSVNQRVVG